MTPKRASYRMGIRVPSNTWFLGLPVTSQTASQLVQPFNSSSCICPTDRETSCYIGINRTHHMLCTAMWLTRSSAIAEGPRNASCQLKSCQLPHNSAETTCTTSPEEIEVMNLEGYSGLICNKHVHSTMMRSSRFHCHIGVINKLTTDVLWILPVYRWVPVAKFSKTTMQKLLTWPWPRPLREHSLITWLRLHMADLCTKFEVSSVSDCGDITWGVKFYKGSPDHNHAPFREDFSSAGWDLLW